MKKYQKPAILVVEMEANAMFALSLNDEVGGTQQAKEDIEDLFDIDLEDEE